MRKNLERTHTAVILFTHDLHSHFMPQAEEDGGTFGGYARLKTAIDEEREEHPGALLVDGGDFSIGSLIQTLYTTQAAELRTMGALGYDAAALGNHEFDHAGTGLASMLEAATDSGGPLPVLLNANYRPAADNPDQGRILEAMDRYGVREAMSGTESGMASLDSWVRTPMTVLPPPDLRWRIWLWRRNAVWRI